MADGVHVLIPASEYAEMESKIEFLEKALDKACCELLVMAMTGSDIELWKKNMTYEQWKEWCMKDV